MLQTDLPSFIAIQLLLLFAAQQKRTLCLVHPGIVFAESAGDFGRVEFTAVLRFAVGEEVEAGSTVVSVQFGQLMDRNNASVNCSASVL